MIKLHLPKILILCWLLLPTLGQSQTAVGQAACQNPDFNKKVKRVLSHSVNQIGVQELKGTIDNYVLLDIRELEEYSISHIPGAIYFGYDNPKYEVLDDLPKDTPIIVYCSIGYRSEKMGEKLLKRGYTNVQNLYGSIFEWANCGYLLVDPMEQATQNIHTYNKRWSKWVFNEDYQKTW